MGWWRCGWRKSTMTAPTCTIRLYMSGDIHEARRVLRSACYPPNEALCVTVEPIMFIYPGGEEAGFVVGFLNYPRFPTEPAVLWKRAEEIAHRLIVRLCQWSALLVAPDQT